VNFLVLLPLGLLVIPFIPTFFEIFRRKDKGPKKIPEQSTYEEKPDLNVPRLERARGEARAKMPGEVIRVTGDVSIPDGTNVDNHLVVQGTLKLGKNSRVSGSVKAFGSVEIGESSIIDGHVLSEGKIIIGRNCVVKGVVDSLKDIILEENAIVEAVSTEKTVKLGPGAKINRRILSGTSIVTSLEQPQVPEVEEVEPAPQPPLEEEHPPVTVKPIEPPQPVQPLQPAEEELVGKKPVIPYEILDPEVGNLFFYAPTRYGKTFMIQNYIIPYLKNKKKIVVIDPHREYPFKSYEIKYDKTIPDVESDLFKTFMTFNVWGDVDRIIKDMIDQMTQSDGNLSLRPDIVDSNVERLIISEFLKRITQIRWKTPILLIVEEADKYDVISIVTRGRHANIQVVLTSAKNLIPEVFSNAHLVLGSMNPLLIRDYDPKAAEAIADLGRFEFIWEKEYHEWRKFQLGLGGGYSTPQVSRAAEEVRPVFKMVEPSIPRTVPPAPSFELPRIIEPKKETEETTIQIFEYLEDRIRKLDESKGGSLDGIRLDNLSQTEVKVFKLACVCGSLEEISLRLLMDPLEIQDILNGLIEKGYLDNDLKPKRPELEKIPKTTVPSKIREPETLQLASVEAETPKEYMEEEEEFPSEEIFEKLIASKMREELKKKLKIETEESSKEEQETIGDEKASAIKEEEKNDVLKKGDNDSNPPHLKDNVQQTETLIEKAGEEASEETRRDESSKNEENEEAAYEFRKTEEESSTSGESSKFSKTGVGRAFKPVAMRNIFPSSLAGIYTLFLPILTLITLLGCLSG